MNKQNLTANADLPENGLEGLAQVRNVFECYVEAKNCMGYM